MRVFVTGAAGFIGSGVVPDLIAAGHTVTGLARSDANIETLKRMGADVLRGSLEDIDSLKRGAAEADGVIHLAFIHDFAKFAENGQIDKRAIEAMGETLAGTNKPLVVTSGVGLLTPGRVSTEEDAAREGAALPRVSEHAAFAFASRGVRVSAVRLPQVHGADGKAGFVGYLHQIAQAKGVSAYIGDGSNRWAAAHRDDVAPVYRLAMEKGGRIGGGKVAHGHGHAAEVFAGCAKGVHVALCKHADPSCWRVKAVGHVPTVVDVLKKR